MLELPIADKEEEIDNSGVTLEIEGKSFHLGYSRIDKYLKCPRSYKLNYVHKSHFAPGPPIRRGSAYHLVLENLLKQKMVGRIPTIEQALKFSERACRFENLNNTDAAKVRQGVQFYYDKMYPKHQPLSVEDSFEIVRGGVKITGRIDLIEKNGRVVDHKFSAEQWTDPRAQYGVQPIIYQWAVDDQLSKLHGVEFTGFHYNVCNTYPLQIQRIKYGRIDQVKSDWWEEQISEVAKGIMAGVFYGNPSDHVCGYCFHKKECNPTVYDVERESITLESE